MFKIFFLLLPVAAASGWFAGFRQQHNEKIGESKKQPRIPADYLIGLNYLIDDNHDKAIDVFIKMLDVNDDTVETHLALGSLFRKRGEVDRAIRIHQNIIARPNLKAEERIRALSELGQDYLRAGFLDRAESIFLEMTTSSSDQNLSYNYLLSIYQLQKDWENAIKIAKKMESKDNNLNCDIAHYYCELAEVAWQKSLASEAEGYLKKALSHDKNCVRASILYGDDAMRKGDYKKALGFYTKVEEQDPDALVLVLASLVKCYESLGKEEELVDYLKKCLKSGVQTALILTLAEKIKKLYGSEDAYSFLLQQIPRCISWTSAHYLLRFYLADSESDVQKKLAFLEKVFAELLEKEPNYRCVHCGFAGKMFYWQCPSCRAWGSLQSEDRRQRSE